MVIPSTDNWSIISLYILTVAYICFEISWNYPNKTRYRKRKLLGIYFTFIFCECVTRLRIELILLKCDYMLKSQNLHRPLSPIHCHTTNVWHQTKKNSPHYHSIDHDAYPLILNSNIHFSFIFPWNHIGRGVHWVMVLKLEYFPMNPLVVMLIGVIYHYTVDCAALWSICSLNHRLWS